MLRSTLTKRRNAALCEQMQANARGLSPISHEQLLKQTQKFARKSGGYAPSVPNFDDAIFINGKPIIDYTEPKFNPLLENNKHFVINKIDNMTPAERQTLFEEFKNKAELQNLDVIDKVITSPSTGKNWIKQHGFENEFRKFLRLSPEFNLLYDSTPSKTRKGGTSTTPPLMKESGKGTSDRIRLNAMIAFAAQHTDLLNQGVVHFQHPVVSAYGLSNDAQSPEFAEFLKSEARFNRAMPERRYQMKPMSSGSVNYPSVSTFTPPIGGYPASPSTSSSGNSSVYTISTP